MVTPVGESYQLVPVHVVVEMCREASGTNAVLSVVQGVDEKVNVLQQKINELLLLHQKKEAHKEEKKKAHDEEKEEETQSEEKEEEASDEEEENEEAQSEEKEEETEIHDEAPVKEETPDVKEEMTMKEQLQNFEKKLNEMQERIWSLEKENAKHASRSREILEVQMKAEEEIELLQARVAVLENSKAPNPSSTASDDLVAVVKVSATLPDLEKVVPRTPSPTDSDAGDETVLIPPTIKVRKSELETKPPQMPKPQQQASKPPTKPNYWCMPHPDAVNVRIPRSTPFNPSQEWKQVPSGVNMDADNGIRLSIVLNEKKKKNPKGRCLYHHEPKGCHLGESCEFDHLHKSVICASLCEHYFDTKKTGRYGSKCAHAHAEGRPNDVPSPPRIEGCDTAWGWNGSLCLVAHKSVRRF